MTTVLAVYEGGVLRPVQPLPLDKGETVEITVARSRPAVPSVSPDESERRIREAGTLQEWIEAANASPPAEDGYDLLQAVSESRHPSERPLVPPPPEAEDR
jgi:predicted DNA-binding antitoxin AbrB/MazE fold protein